MGFQPLSFRTFSTTVICAALVHSGLLTIAQEPLPQAASKSNSPSQRLEAPITIIDAGEYSDGGTIFVRLKDAKEKELLLCVTQDGFESILPANTLFFNAQNPVMESARLPLTMDEATQAVAALEAAVNAQFDEEERKAIAEIGDPLELLWYERATKPKTSQRSREEWLGLFAFDAWRRLKTVKELPVMDAAGKSAPEWYVKFDAARKAQLEAARQERKLDARFKSYFPEKARQYFEFPPDADEFASDENTNKQADLVIDAVGDPVELAVAICKALGSIENLWRVTTNDRDRIALKAVESVSPEDFAKALDQISDDQSALLGAARVFFELEYSKKMSDADLAKWTVPIAEVVLNSSEDSNKLTVLEYFSRGKDPKDTELLRRVARGESGAPVNRSRIWGQEPDLCEAAYMCLAGRGDVSVKEEIAGLLPKATLPQNRAALEVSLASLGDPNYIKKEHFELQSSNISLEAVNAIEKFQGKHGMDLLMTGALESSAGNEALLAAERITGQTWYPPGSNHQPINFKEDAQAWWKAHGEEFKKRMIEKQPN